MKLRRGKKIAVFLGMFGMLLLSGCADNIVPVNGNPDKTNVDYEAIYNLTQTDANVSLENAEVVALDAAPEVLVLDKPGDYLLSGSYHGQIQIDVQDETVHLILDNVEINAPNGPAIYVKSAAKVVITIPEESSCLLMDSPYYDEFPDTKACVYSASDLTINGSGRLQVYGYFRDAIRTKDTLKILDTNLEVQAKDTGLRGNDGVVLRANALNIQCEGTGIFTEKEDKPNKGFVDIAAGTVQIIAGEYGINASENIYIRDCTADIYGIVGNLTCQGEQHIEEGCLE